MSASIIIVALIAAVVVVMVMRPNLLSSLQEDTTSTSTSTSTSTGSEVQIGCGLQNGNVYQFKGTWGDPSEPSSWGYYLAYEKAGGDYIANCKNPTSDGDCQSNNYNTYWRVDQCEDDPTHFRLIADSVDSSSTRSQLACNPDFDTPQDDDHWGCYLEPKGTGACSTSTYTGSPRHFTIKQADNNLGCILSPTSFPKYAVQNDGNDRVQLANNQTNFSGGNLLWKPQLVVP